MAKSHSSHPPHLTRLLRHRRPRRHAGHHALQDTLAHSGPRAQPLAPDLLQAAHESPAQALERLGSRVTGLSPAEAAARLARVGPNEVTAEPAMPAWRHLWHCYRDPFNLLLSTLAVFSLASGDGRGALVISAMVVLSTLIRFVQEGRSHAAADSLRALVGNTASVLRGGTAVELPQRDLVPGDVISLSAGDMVPADCRLLATTDLFVAQAAMTGEALPVEKFAAASHDTAGALAQHNLVFMGTNVVSGAAQALVLATGPRSYFGALAAHVAATDPEPTAFEAGMHGVSWLLIRFALVLVPVVLLINGFTKGDWLQAALFALSVAVGLTPEMLPMIVASTLARGAVRLSRKKVVVKRLEAMQNFGAMDLLCTDKTGTLTQDRIALARNADIFGQPSDGVLSLAWLNSQHQTGLKNLLDRAVLARVPAAESARLAAAWHKLDEVPFDFQRRRMSVLVAEGQAAPQLVCKGALDEVLSVCTTARVPGGAVVPLDAALRARVMQVAADWAAEGLRVVAVATRTLPAGQTDCSVADEAALTLEGNIAFLDPPRESAAPALRALAAHGVQVKVLTGDNALVTQSVCREVGLVADKVLLGDAVEAMDDVALAVAVQQHQVFARLAPLHKERIVRALRANGHIVGFLGDGINDAPALRAADIGISVDTAVDIAREAADIILLEKSLMVLDDGVVEGRTTFCNLLKYIRMTASSNFGNVLSVLVASAFLPFLPMLPLQLLVQNLLYDLAQTGIPFDRVDAELVNAPLRWQPAGIGRFMLCFGPLSSLFDLATFALMWWVFAADTPAEQGLFQSGWFVVGLLTQTLVVQMIRTPRLRFFLRPAAPALLASTGAIVALGLWLPQGPLAGLFALQPLPAAYFGWLAALLLGYALLVAAMKHWYVARYGWS